MSDNKILQAIDYLEAQKRLFPNSFNVLSGHFDTAIEALQEKAEREKGCWCCDPSTPDDKWREGWTVEAKNEKEDPQLMKINFCPHCGRDLRKPVNE